MSAAPPHSVEAEQSLLGALLLKPAAWSEIVDVVGADDLFRADHRLIFGAVAVLVDHEQPPDPVTVGEHLQRLGQLEAAGGIAYLARLVEDTPSAANIRAYAKIVREHARRRQLAELGARLAEDATSDHDLAGLVELHQRAVAEVSGELAGAVRSPLRAVPMNDLGSATLPAPRFLIAPILPRGFCTLLGGHGDAGKSLLALTIAAHVSCGTPFGELACISGRSLIVSLEDDAALVRLRLARIAATFGLDVGTIARGVTVLEAVGDDSALAFEQTLAGTRRLAFTSVLEQVRTAAAGHSLVVIDNASDAFDANENERRLVRRFVRALQDLGRQHDAAVLLLAHIDKAAARFGGNGQTYSGSTAWHNSVRSRLALLEGDSGLELRHEKCNLAKPLERPIRLERAEHGVPVPISRAAAERSNRSDLDAVLAAIRGVHAAGLSVPTATAGSKPVTQVLATRPELPDDLAASPDRIRAALVRLEREGAVWREAYRDPEQRKQRERFRCAE